MIWKMPARRVALSAAAFFVAAAIFDGRAGAQNTPKLPTEFVNGLEAVADEVLVELRSNTPASIAAVNRAAFADRNELLGSTGWRRVHSSTRGVQALLQILAT